VQVELSDSTAVADLIAHLTDHGACVTELRPGVLAVGFVGSWSTDAQLIETERRLRQWMASHPHVVVAVTER
jgi:hypothetical protein